MRRYGLKLSEEGNALMLLVSRNPPSPTRNRCDAELAGRLQTPSSVQPLFLNP